MNKISRKLICYILGVMFFFSCSVFAGFYGILKNQMMEHHVTELQDKVTSVRDRMEESFNNENEQTMCVCLKYLDEITLTEVYIVRADGEPFICQMCDGCEKAVPQDVQQFGQKVMKSDIGRNTVIEKKDGCLTAGALIEEGGKVSSAVVIEENVKFDKENMVLPLAVLGGCLLFAMVLAAIAAVCLVKRFMRPIREIAEVTGQMADGNYQVKIQRFDDDEVGDLARRMNILASRLDESNKKAERMQQMQKDYIANISHELRTPVAVIRSSLEAMKDQVIPEEQIPEYQQQVVAETIMLQRLVDDMLELSRLENDDFVIEKERIDVRQVLDDSIRAIRMLAADHKIRIESNQNMGEWEFFGDYGRLRQMFTIALENAVKYSEDGKKILITTREKKDDYYISIQDEGCGIPEEKQKHIFEKFYRVSYNQKEGTGLGLVIMKNIAKRHGIQIHLHSFVGRGTKITYIIPKMTQE